MDNAPTPSLVSIQLIGGNSIIDTITLSQPVVNPVAAIQSLGSPWDQATYTFTSPFTLLNSGAGHWGVGSNILVQNGYSLTGLEGNGIIQFEGTFTSIIWTVPDGENYRMYTGGAPSAVPIPGAVWLLGSGLLGLIGLKRRFRG